MKLVAGVQRQVGIVASLLATLADEFGLVAPPRVRGGLVFVNAEFGLFSAPFVLDGVWVGWGSCA